MMQETKGMQLVWPKDGAILNPIFLLAKSSSKEKVQPLIEFILSKNLAKRYLLTENSRQPTH